LKHNCANLTMLHIILKSSKNEIATDDLVIFAQKLTQLVKLENLNLSFQKHLEDTVYQDNVIVNFVNILGKMKLRRLEIDFGFMGFQYPSGYQVFRQIQADFKGNTNITVFEVHYYLQRNFYSPKSSSTVYIK